ncbi:MAG TPA: GNAT family protein [Candidatus Dormibacteraeota bacterium]|nr:GNAT family protein [Candidatus Dormibacteraeota bacterium]
MIEQTLLGENVRLRPVQPDDTERLQKIFADPAVSQWWGDAARSVGDAMNPTEGESCFVIELGPDAIGFIQCHEELDPTYRSAGIDLALRSEWQGIGLGPDAIKTLARHLITEGGHHRLTIDPAAHNIRAIKAYRSVGFRPVGIMRKYERGPSGEWHDGLLMDLLAEDVLPG